MKTRAVVFAVITVIWCCVIFFFSSQDADESSDLSDSFIYSVCDALLPDFEDYTEAQREQLLEDLTFGVRKTAHFTVYAFLGAFAFQALCIIGKKHVRAVSAVGFSCLYAASDEFHQTFVPGRSGEVRDVLIDTSGALLSVLISLLVIHFIGKRWNKETGDL